MHGEFQLDKEPGRRPRHGDGRGAAAGQGSTHEIVARMEKMEQLIIEDISLDESQARVTVLGLPDIPGLAAQVFDEIAEAGIVVDMIVQSVGRAGTRQHLLHRPPGGPGQEPQRRRRAGRARWAARRRCSCPSVAKLSVFGVGMKSHTNVASRMFQSLAAEGINVELISTTEVRVNVVVDGRHGEKARAALLREFADAMVVADYSPSTSFSTSSLT